MKTKPVIINARRRVDRPPMRHYLRMNGDGTVHKSCLRSIPTARFTEILKPHGTFTTEGSSPRFRFSNGNSFKIELEQTHKGDVLDGLDFSVETKESKEQLRIAQQLVDVLNESGLLGEVFQENPYYNEEVIVSNKLFTGQESSDVRFRSPKEILKEIKSKQLEGDLYVPDIHTEMYEIRFIEQLLKTGWFDWFALEMVPHTMQPVLDNFINHPRGAEALTADKATIDGAYEAFINARDFRGFEPKEKLPVQAELHPGDPFVKSPTIVVSPDDGEKQPGLINRFRKMPLVRAIPIVGTKPQTEKEKADPALLMGEPVFVKRPSRVEYLRIQAWRLETHLRRKWNSYFTELGTSKGPYFDLLVLCRQHRWEKNKNFRVYGINNESEYYFSNYKWHETGRLVIGTRNLIWANSIPREGRGIIFGGWLHFLHPIGYFRVQDFLGARDRELGQKRTMWLANFGDLDQQARYYFRLMPW